MNPSLSKNRISVIAKWWINQSISKWYHIEKYMLFSVNVIIFLYFMGLFASIKHFPHVLIECIMQWVNHCLHCNWINPSFENSNCGKESHRALADSQESGHWTRWREATERSPQEQTALTQHSHSRPGLLCPSRAVSSSGWRSTVRS